MTLSTFPVPTVYALWGLSVPARHVQAIKWAASIAQILGYAATAAAIVPLNLYFFLIGLLGWMTVGFFWRDRAIIAIHVVALAAMIAGLAGR